MEKTKAKAKDRLKCLLNKEIVCGLDRKEIYELQCLIDRYGYPTY